MDHSTTPGDSAIETGSAGTVQERPAAGAVPPGPTVPDGDGTPTRLPAAFHRLWTAAVVSGLGDGLRYTALPLLAASVSRAPSDVAAVTVAGMLPWLLFGLFVGVLADRVDRRTLMWTTDLVRGLVVAGFAVLLVVGEPSIPLIVAFAFAVGSAQVVFDTAAGAFLPAVVGPAQLGAANGRLMAAQVLTSQFIGPPIAGLVFAFSVGWLFAVDAFTFVLAAVLVLTIRVPRREPGADGAGVGRDVIEGLRWLNRHRVLRDQSVIYGAMALVSGALLGIFVLYVNDHLGLGSLGYGLLMACFALGNVAVAPLVPRLRARWGDRAALTAAVVVVILTLTSLALLPTPVVAGLSLFLFGAAAMTWMVVTVTVRQELVPDALLGRVTSTYRMIGFGANPLGALAAGVTATLIGIRPMLAVGAVLVAVVAVAFRAGLGSQTAVEEHVGKDPGGA
ncbi:MFS transporter [Micromonospora sp. NPDC023956]|uniref:MFS transporter n=1 Tax=Micromonospora sp. NPDC023956 TaxID=3155722 RepID=UPI00340584D5